MCCWRWHVPKPTEPSNSSRHSRQSTWHVARGTSQAGTTTQLLAGTADAPRAPHHCVQPIVCDLVIAVAGRQARRLVGAQAALIREEHPTAQRDYLQGKHNKHSMSTASLVSVDDVHVLHGTARRDNNEQRFVWHLSLCVGSKVAARQLTQQRLFITVSFYGLPA